MQKMLPPPGEMFIPYTFGWGVGGQKMNMICTLMKMLTIIDALPTDNFDLFDHSREQYKVSLCPNRYYSACAS